MTGQDEQEAVYRFDRFCLDVARGTLRGPGGADLALRPKAFALLHHLLRHPGRLHGREELFEALWPGVSVTDDSLTQCMSDLRRVLGDRANHVLRTLTRRGYVLTADVDRQTVRPVAGQAVTIQPPTAAVAASPADLEAARCALVFLLRPEASQGISGAGLESEFLNELFMRLARFEDLRVVNASADTPVEGYRVRSDGHVVGQRFRSSILLEDVETGAVIWAEQQDVPADDIAAMTEILIIPLASRIARQVAAESRRRARHKPAAAHSARELCLLASDHHQRGTEADTAIAHDLLDRAIALDPDYAQAFAWQAYVVQRGLTYGWGSVKGEAARARALDLARHGAVLAPYSPLCLSRLAYCLLLYQRWDEAVATARMALNGTRAAGINVRVTCSEVFAHTGHAGEAIEVMQLALQLDPYCPPTVHSVLGRSLLMAGRPEEALPMLRICAARLPDYAPCYHSLLMAAHETGRMDEARYALEEIHRLQPGWHPQNGTGPWFFRNAADAERLHAAFDAAQRGLAQQHSMPAADVLNFRARDMAKRT